jgi:SpoVK/Ycf46/Vps4 family AAA+-type ATPase
MSNPLSDLFFGGGFSSGPQAADVVEPTRTFADVILPEDTRRQLDRALTQIRKRRLIGREWGLAERHPTGLGLAFNFAGPPGTGKTLCAEALADALDRNLMVVRYDEMQSMWMGATGKNIASVFAAARDDEAVLFFDEADAIAGRRTGNVGQGGYEREANAIVNVLLRELEEHDGVVIFATNLAANLDPAFERRIRTHVLFEMPSAEARRKIWQVQLHRQKTPLAGDVDFEALAERFEASGGDIKNAVLNAAQAAAAEPGPDQKKKIAQRHFIQGMEAVQAGKQVMKQSLFGEGDGAKAAGASLAGGPTDGAGGGPQAALARHFQDTREKQEQLATRQEVLTERLEALGDQQEQQSEQLLVVERALELLTDQIDQSGQAQQKLSERFDRLEATREDRRRGRLWVQIGVALALLLAAAALVLAISL